MTSLLDSISDSKTQNKSTFQKDNLIRIFRDCEFNVIPLRNKKPPEDWKEWQERRIDTDGTLARWFNGKFKNQKGSWWWDGDLNWAVLTGPKPWSKIPGIVCLDADDDEAAALVEKRCPPTPLITTTSAGKHFIYKHPGHYVKQRIGTYFDGVDFNLDVKGDKNYIVAPGSTKGDHVYRASADWTPDLIVSLPVYDPNWIRPDDSDEDVQTPAEETRTEIVWTNYDAKGESC